MAASIILYIIVLDLAPLQMFENDQLFFCNKGKGLSYIANIYIIVEIDKVNRLLVEKIPESMKIKEEK